MAAKSRLALILPLVLFVVLGGAFYIGLQRDNAEELPSVFLDRAAPPLPGDTLGDHPLATADDLTGEGFKLVNFWASWCPPCRAEHPQLMALAEEGWTIIGVNKSDTAANAQGFLDELGNPYTAIAADPTGRNGIEWGVYGLPETFLIDPNGHIRHRYPGPITKRIWEDRFLPVVEKIRSETR